MAHVSDYSNNHQVHTDFRFTGKCNYIKLPSQYLWDNTSSLTITDHISQHLRHSKFNEKKVLLSQSVDGGVTVPHVSRLDIYSSLLTRPFWKAVKLAVRVSKVRTKFSVNIMNFWIRLLNNWWQESLFLAFVIILIILFFNFKYISAVCRIAQKNYDNHL